MAHPEPVTVFATPANPTAPAVQPNNVNGHGPLGNPIMMGLGLSITPALSGSGTVLALLTGTIQFSGGASISSDFPSVQLYFGTGTAPTNGAAVTGTAFGNVASWVPTGFPSPFTLLGSFSSTAAITYWVDVAVTQYADNSDTSSIAALAAFLQEQI